jgi:hypothetical protein
MKKDENEKNPVEEKKKSKTQQKKTSSRIRQMKKAQDTNEETVNT